MKQKNTNPLFRLFPIAVILVMLLCLLPSCKKVDRSKFLFTGAEKELLDQYFDAASVGIVSASQPLRFVLKNSFTEPLSNEVIQKLISLSPSVAGTTTVDNNTIITFIPSVPLESDKVYKINIDLSSIDPNVYKEKISYEILTKKQEIAIDNRGFELYDDGSVAHRFSIKTADFVTVDKLKFCFGATDAVMDIKEIDSYEYLLLITYANKNQVPSNLSFDITPIGGNQKGSHPLIKNDNKAFEVASYYYNPNTREATFFMNNIISKSQDLTGLVTVDGNTAQYTHINNIITVFLSEYANKSEISISISGSLKSINNNTLIADEIFNIDLNRDKPEITFHDSGNYFPSEGDFKIPVKTRGLSAMRLQVIEIKQQNVSQFLAWQSIEYTDFYNIRSFGRPIYDEIVELSRGITDDQGWLVHGIDLSKHIKKNPGSIYCIGAEFGPEHTTLSCKKDLSKYNIPMQLYDMNKFDRKAQESNDYYGYYEDGSYNWEEREDPCKLAYYLNRNIIQRIFVCSDYNILVKKVGNGYEVAVTDLMDLTTVLDAKVTLYDMQGIEMATSNTDTDGFASFAGLYRDATMVKVSKEDKISYIAVDENLSNPLTEFEISGDNSSEQTGFFVYAERNLWRPGDSIFVDLMVSKTMVDLPDGLPIEMKFYNPDNLVILKKTQRLNLNNKQIYSFTAYTPSNAKTGLYRCVITIGPKTLTKNIRVETIKPNTSEVTYTFSNVKDKVVYAENLSGQFTVKYLTGFAAANAKVAATARSFAIAKPFAKYVEYNFSSPEAKFINRNITLFDIKTDENGRGSFKNNYTLKAFKSPFNLAIETETTLADGGVSKEGSMIKVSPFAQYVGIKRKSGSAYQGQYTYEDNITLDLVSLNKFGALNNTDNAYTYTIEVNENSWWVDKYQLSSSGNFIYDSHWSNYRTENLSFAGMKKLVLSGKDFKRGAYRIRVKDNSSGHYAEEYFTVYDGKESLETSSPNIFDFTTDKTEYNIGDRVTIKLPSIPDALALVSIETGAKVISKQWVKLSSGDNFVNLTADESWSPNVYIHISLFQKYMQADNDFPLRMYGVKYITVDGSSTKLLPKTNFPEKVESNKSYSFTVEEINGKPMEYTFAIVDEGLLGLTGFATPDPFNYFAGKQPLLVKTWDIYKYLLRFFKGKFAGIISIGGDAAYSPDATPETNRFKPVVIHQGSFVLAKGGKNTHKVTIPNYIGKLRLMIVAGKDKAFGKYDQPILVKNPLMIQSQMPRVLNVTDKVQLPVTILKDEPSIKSATITASAQSGYIKGLTPSSTIDLASRNQATQIYDIEVLNKVGKVDFNFTVSGNGNKMQEVIPIMINYPNNYTYEVANLVIQPSETKEITVKSRGYAEAFKSSITLSGMKVPNFVKYADELLDYPYGCLEQTTSSAFAQLYLDKVMQLTPVQNQARIQNIKIAIERITKFQTKEGRFNYWENGYYSGWADVYAGHFLVEVSKDRSFESAASMLQKWIEYNTKIANNFAISGVSSKYVYESESVLQAYRLYVLSLANNAQKSAMNRFVSANEATSPMVWWLMAGAYNESSFSSKALELKAKAEKLRTNDLDDDYDSFGDKPRNLALITLVINKMNGLQSETKDYYESMVDNLNSAGWASTQTKGFSFLAAYSYLGNNASTNKTVKYTIAIGKTKESNEHSSFEPRNFVLGKDSYPTKISITNQGNAPLNVSRLEQYIDDNITQAAKSSGLDVKVEYSTQSPKLGDNIGIRVTVANLKPQDMKSLALNLRMPSGWELINPRIYQTSTSNSERYTYQDYKDDRVFTFFDLSASRSTVFEFKAKAAFVGNFYMPSISCEHMYNGNVYAQTSSGRVSVTK